MSGQFPARSYQRSQMQVSELRLTRLVRTLFKSRFEIDRYGRRRERRFLRDEDDIFRAGFLHLALRGIPNRNVAWPSVIRSPSVRRAAAVSRLPFRRVPFRIWVGWNG